MRRWLAMGTAIGLGASFLFLVGGCDLPPPSNPWLEGDAELFEQAVQPVIARRCAFLVCHGVDGLPLTLYAVGYLRFREPVPTGEPAAHLSENELSERELEHNRRTLIARAGPQDPGGRTLLQRLIPVRRGGIPHADGAIFEDESDPEFQVIQEFLQTAYAP